MFGGIPWDGDFCNRQPFAEVRPPSGKDKSYHSALRLITKVPGEPKSGCLACGFLADSPL